jgi:hypothetical protein
MLDSEAVFNEIVKGELWPSFKKLGYKKAGNNFRYYNSAGWGRIVQFQKSRYNTGTKLSFTVNISLYLADFEYYLCSTKSEYKFQEAVCAVRKRLGPISGRQSDSWIIFDEYSDRNYIKKIVQQLHDDFMHHIHPYLAGIESKEDILAILAAGHNSNYPLAQIQTMFDAGAYYRAATLDLIKSELPRSRYNQSYYLDLQSVIKKLGISNEALFS